MNRIWTMLFLVLPIFLFGNDYEEKISLANDFYKNKQYESAIEIYEGLINSGVNSSSIFYNLGNSYFRIGKLGLSVLNLERAKKLNPNDEDVIHNLEFVSSRITDKIEPIPKFFLFGWWESIITVVSANTLIISGYFIYLSIVILILLFVFNKSVKIKRKIFFTIIPISVILALVVIIIFGKVNYESVNEFGVIIESRISVKNSPDEKETDLFILHEGLKVKIEDNVDNWIQVRLADGKVGWVLKSQIAKI
jgi:tetratricopeptide (TPR) repeat protein